MGIKQYHLVISGGVQGVYYRASALQQAELLGIAGWVKNLADGRVEMLIEGEANILEKMVDWAKQGPPNAKVDNIEVTELSANKTFDGFDIR